MDVPRGVWRAPSGKTINNLYWNHLFKEFFEVRQFQVIIRKDRHAMFPFSGRRLESREGTEIPADVHAFPGRDSFRNPVGRRDTPHQPRQAHPSCAGKLDIKINGTNQHFLCSRSASELHENRADPDRLERRGRSSIRGWFTRDSTRRPEMAESFFRDLNIPEPEENLGISGGTSNEQTARVMLALETLYRRRGRPWCSLWAM